MTSILFCRAPSAWSLAVTNWPKNASNATTVRDTDEAVSDTITEWSIHQLAALDFVHSAALRKNYSIGLI